MFAQTYTYSRKDFSTGFTSSYSFGYQGQEMDNEITGVTGADYAFKYRMADSRLGRFWSVDPLASKYPYNSPYAFSENRVIDGIELEGLEFEKIKQPGNYEKGQVANDEIENIVPDQSWQNLQFQKELEKTQIKLTPQNASVNETNSNEMDVKQRQTIIINREKQIEKNIENLQFRDPVSFGSKTTGLGLVPCLIEGVKQAPSMIIEAFVVTNILKLSKPIMTYNTFAKATVGTFKGASQSTLRGAAFQMYKTESILFNKSLIRLSNSTEVSFKVYDLLILKNEITIPYVKTEINIPYKY